MFRVGEVALASREMGGDRSVKWQGRCDVIVWHARIVRAEVLAAAFARTGRLLGAIVRRPTAVVGARWQRRRPRPAEIAPVERIASRMPFSIRSR